MNKLFTEVSIITTILLNGFLLNIMIASAQTNIGLSNIYNNLQSQRQQVNELCNNSLYTENQCDQGIDSLCRMTQIDILQLNDLIGKGLLSGNNRVYRFVQNLNSRTCRLSQTREYKTWRGWNK